MKTIRYPEKNTWETLLQRPSNDYKKLDETVSIVIEDIRLNGDAAIKKYTLQYDKVSVQDICVSLNEINTAEKKIDAKLKQAIRIAASNIKKFHKAQKQKELVISTMHGVVCRQKSIPIDKVGLYIPGGSAPLFSTVLMLAIPAQIAGCKEIILCTPPSADGSIHPAILYAAKITGVKKVFKAGGIQAIAAMAYGTESIPAVYKIFGPGNQYVTAAKQILSRYKVAIDMPAGPSEVAVMADNSAVPAFVAADLLSQAEHGADSQVILVSTSEKFIEKVNIEMEKQVLLLSRKEIAIKALENSKAILVKNEKEMLELIQRYAPEHLIISTKNHRKIARMITNAGSVFLGNFTPESAGDYASGTNHTLPTNGWARSFSGVNLDSYYKKITFQEITQTGLDKIGPIIELMATAEELTAHANAVKIRRQFKKKDNTL